MRHLAAAATCAAALVLFPSAALAAGGDLGFIQSEINGLGGVTGLGNATATAVSPDGKNVYVAACGDSAVAVFARNPSDGKLTFVEAEKEGVGGVSGLKCAAGVAVSPDGKNVYVPGQDSSAIAVFSRDPSSGSLSFVEAAPGAGPWIPGGVAVSPDGAQVYATDFGDLNRTPGVGGVLVFDRDPATGALSFASQDTGLGGAGGVAVSPDGKSAYVAALTDDALGLFSRNATTGALTSVGVLHDNAGGVDGLSAPTAVALSHDGANVYVTADVDQSVATFARDASTSALSYRGIVHKDLHGARDVVVSPDDANVYAVAFGAASLVTLARDQATGGLTFVKSNTKYDRGDDGFKGVWGVDASPDGKNVYTANLMGDSASTWMRNPPPFSAVINAKRKQSTDALGGAVKCSLGCDYVAKAKVKVGKAKFKSNKAKGTLAGLAPARVAFEFSSTQLKAIAKALKHDKGTATLTFEGFAAKDQKSATASVKLKR